MKKSLLFLCTVVCWYSCNNAADKSTTTDTTKTAVAEKKMIDLPYTATYSSSFTDDVPDADLKMVLMTYKDWADGNIQGLVGSVADTLAIDAWDGTSMQMPKAGLIKMWTSFRDSLSSVKVEMQGWQKMHSTDKNDNFILTWYKEYDTFKNGKVDSASWHDINQVKDGKIIWYSQYKRPMKKK